MTDFKEIVVNIFGAVAADDGVKIKYLDESDLIDYLNLISSELKKRRMLMEMIVDGEQRLSRQKSCCRNIGV